RGEPELPTGRAQVGAADQQIEELLAQGHARGYTASVSGATDPRGAAGATGATPGESRPDRAPARGRAHFVRARRRTAGRAGSVSIFETIDSARPAARSAASAAASTRAAAASARSAAASARA